MFIIQHKTYGEGKVINKEMKGGDIIITAQVGEDKQCSFAAESFRIGAVKADGTLKAEIDAVIAAKQAAEEERRNAVRVLPVAAPAASSKRHGRIPVRKATAKGAIQTQYEAYLEAAGYPVFGINGNLSTVPQYSRAVEKVVEREGLSWSQLSNDIANIVQKYDKDGAEEDFGNRGNKTVINALKRFQEFVSD